MNCLRNLANMTLQRLPVKQANQRNQTIKQRDSSALEQVKILTLSAAEPASRALAVHSRGSERRGSARMVWAARISMSVHHHPDEKRQERSKTNAQNPAAKDLKTKVTVCNMRPVRN